jgi:hypothetical protein
MDGDGGLMRDNSAWQKSALSLANFKTSSNNS